MLGKRPRRPMRRTTSMAEIGIVEAVQPHEQQPFQRERHRSPAAKAARTRDGCARADWLEAAALHVAGGFAVAETAPFLRACGLCNRKLGPGRDTFMYRGEVAFCSLECRQQQMNVDDRKEKGSLTSMKDAPAAAGGGSEQSGSSETVAAA